MFILVAHVAVVWAACHVFGSFAYLPQHECTCVVFLCLDFRHGQGPHFRGGIDEAGETERVGSVPEAGTDAGRQRPLPRHRRFRQLSRRPPAGEPLSIDVHPFPDQ